MCFFFFFFFSHFSFFILFTYSLHTLWPRYLQTCIKGSCISFLSTFLQNYSWNSKIPSKSAASAEKNVSNNDRMEVFSTDIHPEKKNTFTNNFQAMLPQSEKVSCIFKQSGNLNFNFFSFAIYPWGYLMEV